MIRKKDIIILRLNLIVLLSLVFIFLTSCDSTPRSARNQFEPSLSVERISEIGSPLFTRIFAVKSPEIKPDLKKLKPMLNQLLDLGLPILPDSIFTTSLVIFFGQDDLIEMGPDKLFSGFQCSIILSHTDAQQQPARIRIVGLTDFLESNVSGYNGQYSCGEDPQRLEVVSDVKDDTAIRNEAKAPPVALISSDHQEVWVGETIHFDASQSHDPNGKIISYEWELAGGKKVITKKPFLAYEPVSKGDWNLRLIVTDDNDRHSSTTIPIKVKQICAFSDSFEISPPQPIVGKTTVISLNQNACSDGLELRWKIPNLPNTNAFFGRRIQVVFGSPGEFHVILDQVNPFGKIHEVKKQVTVARPIINNPPVAFLEINSAQIWVGQTVRLDASRSIDPDKDELSFKWILPDMTTKITKTPFLDYTFEEVGNQKIRVLVTDDKGANSSSALSVSVRGICPFVGSFEQIPSNPHAGEEITFIATDCVDGLSFEWEIVDGLSVTQHTGNRARHSFTTDGEYVVILRQKNPFISAKEVRQHVVVTRLAELPVRSIPPTLIIKTFPPKGIVQGSSVTLDASKSFDDGQINTYLWDIGADGIIEKTTTRSSIKWLFNKEGTYVVKVIGIDDKGVEGFSSISVEILPKPVQALPFLSAGIDQLDKAPLYQWAIGIPISSLWSLSAGIIYGQGTKSVSGYKLDLESIAYDAQMRFRVFKNIHFGLGGGMLKVSGNYTINWPTNGPKSFTKNIPFLSASIGYQWGFIMLSLGFHYAL